MPWKIKKCVRTGDAACVHMHDPQENLHMVTSLCDGAIDVYIGDENPRFARLHVTVLVDGLEVAHRGHNRRDLTIVDSVLHTLGIPTNEIHMTLGELRGTAKRDPVIQRRPKAPPVQVMKLRTPSV